MYLQGIGGQSISIVVRVAQKSGTTKAKAPWIGAFGGSVWLIAVVKNEILAEGRSISAKILRNAAQHNAIIRNAGTRSDIGFAADASISLHCMKLHEKAFNRKFLGGSLCG